MAELYQGMPGSPITYLTENVTASQASIPIDDEAAVPDAPNICTINDGVAFETIKYAGKENGSLTGCERGAEGTAKAWQAGQEVARYFTSYDHFALLEQVQPLATPPGWIDATLQNGWSGFVRYRKNAIGQVELMGRIMADSGEIKSIVATMPDRYYPQVTTPIQCVILQTGNIFHGLQLRSNGEIRNYRDDMKATDEYGFTIVIPI